MVAEHGDGAKEGVQRSQAMCYNNFRTTTKIYRSSVHNALQNSLVSGESHPKTPGPANVSGQMSQYDKIVGPVIEEYDKDRYRAYMFHTFSLISVHPHQLQI